MRNPFKSRLSKSDIPGAIPSSDGEHMIVPDGTLREGHGYPPVAVYDRHPQTGEAGTFAAVNLTDVDAEVAAWTEKLEGDTPTDDQMRAAVRAAMENVDNWVRPDEEVGDDARIAVFELDPETGRIIKP